MIVILFQNYLIFYKSRSSLPYSSITCSLLLPYLSFRSSLSKVWWIDIATAINVVLAAAFTVAWKVYTHTHIARVAVSGTGIECFLTVLEPTMLTTSTLRSLHSPHISSLTGVMALQVTTSGTPDTPLYSSQISSLSFPVGCPQLSQLQTRAIMPSGVKSPNLGTVVCAMQHI